jgi:amino acid adenylation domain-containing protein/non-ribosomal peptide synthase protein (TIGR01720 family)
MRLNISSDQKLSPESPNPEASSRPIGTNPNPGKTHVIIGDGALALRCADVLQQNGHTIAIFASRYAKTRESAEQNGITTVDSPSAIVPALAGIEIDCLFSIVNDDILPDDLLSLPKHAAINYHDGPLPRYAGVHATSWAIINGEKKHGVTWHLMCDQIDAGDIILQSEVDILPTDNALALNARCLEAGVTLFEQFIQKLSHLHPEKQDLTKRTLYPRFQRPPAACVIDFTQKAADIANLVRALDFGHHPNTLGTPKIAIDGQFHTVTTTDILFSGSTENPGTIIDADKTGLVVATADNDIRLRCNTDGIQTGTIANSDLTLLTELNESLAKAEPFWTKRLKNIQPLRPPYLKSGEPKGEPLTLEQPVPENFTEADLLTAFTAYLSRLSEGTHIAYPVDSPIDTLTATEVPFDSKIDLTKDFAANVKSTSKELALLKKKDTYLLDLLPRQKLQHPNLVVSASSRNNNALSFNPATKTWHTTTALIDPADLERMRDQFTLFLGGIVSAPQTPLRDIPLVAETSPFLDEPATHFAADAPLHRIFEKQAKLTPDAIALTCDGQSLTYAHLNTRANNLARHLRANHDIKPDTLIGICCERDMDVVIGILGILKAGAAYLPIDLAYPADRLAFMLEDSQAPVLLTQRPLEARLPGHNAAVIFIDELIAPDVVENLDIQTNLDDLAYVIFTSGSTGQPKGAEITHRNVVRLMRATEHWFGFDQNDVWTLFHSYAFDFSVWELWGPLLYGGRLVIVPFAISRSPRDFYQLLSQEKITVLNQTPSAFRQLIRAEEENGQLPLTLRYIIFGGEALEMQSLKPWYDRHGDKEPQLVNMYGITETTVHVTYRPLSADDLDFGSVIGEPIPDLKIHILDEQQNAVPVGIPGEMYVSGAGLARGYLNRPELTAQRFLTKDNTRLYRTGDVAKFLPNGDIEYLGRCDDQVKIRGFRIELGEIESVLCQHDQVREACVIAKEGRLIGYLVTKSDAPTVSDLRQHLLQKVPDYMVPAAFVFLKEFPLTNNGKTDRKALPEPGQQRADLDTTYAAPTTDPEKTLTQIWQQVLKLEKVGVNDHFFELGGDSILSIQIVAKARQQGLLITPKSLFDHPTIADLAKESATERGAGVSPARAMTVSVMNQTNAQSANPKGKSQPFPQTPIQHWFAEQNLPTPGHYNQSFHFTTTSPLDPKKLNQALIQIVNHHDALRLTFDNNYSQKVAPKITTLAPNKNFNLTTGCLLHYTLTGTQLFIAIHHLAMDGVSWRILIEDIETAYKGLPLPEKTASFADWSHALQTYKVPAKARIYWNKIPPTPKPPVTLEQETRSHTVTLTPAETERLLRQVPAAHGVRINDILLTALARAFDDHTDLVIDTEGHGREHIIAPDLDTSRTIGWFTSIFPVQLDPKNLEQLAENGIHYGILRYLEKAIDTPVDPEIIFNYLGQFDGTDFLKFAPEQPSIWHAPNNTRRHSLEITCQIRDGKFELTFVYAKETPGEIAAAADKYLATLRNFMHQDERYPLAPLQELYYTLESARANAGLDQWHARITGPVDANRLRQAWQSTIDRHSALRTSFTHDGQTVHPSVAIDFRETNDDLTVALAKDETLGFDLTHPPLTRVTIVQNEHLIWTHHHLQVDGWSWPLIFADVAKAYAGETLPEAPQYRTYIDWLATRDTVADCAFWTNALEGFNTSTQLPGSDHGNRFEEMEHTLPQTLSADLQKLARSNGVTLNNIIQAAWAILLARQSGNDDIVFGAAFSGRPFELPESVDTVGVYVNNLPVRLTVAKDTTPLALFKALQSWQYSAGEHQYLPLTDIQECSAIPHRQRLFDSLLVFQNYEMDDSIFQLGPDARIEKLVAPIRTNYPLTLAIEPRDFIKIRAIFAAHRFEEGYIKSVLTHIETLLTGFLTNQIPHIDLPQTAPPAAPTRPAGKTYTAPRTDTERKIAAIWQQAFGIEKIGTTDNFFDLGGQSLLMIQVHARLRKDLGIDLPIVTVFKYPTIGGLAAHLDGESKNVVRASRPHSKKTTNIAIIGLVTRVPGADTPDQLWQNLTDAKETISTITDADLRAEGFDPTTLDADGEYIRRRGLIDRPEWFDAGFFGMNPREAEVTDPQQRLFLEAAWQTLETAGYVPEKYDGDIGIYGGMSNSTYYLNNVHNNARLRESVGELAAMMGSEKDYLTTRVAYKLNLTGPAVNVYTACSTSMVAVSQAVAGLIAGDCDMALAGGVSVTFPLHRGYYTNEGGITSRDGHCRPFDANANGTVFSNGLGMVALKRLDDAIADGDTIHAVIKGVGINNDGSDKVSFTAPSVLGQSGAIRKALTMSGLDANSISYIETHGTGTPLGDPIEIAGLTEVYGESKNKIAIGSLKSNTGHMDAAAGIGGLIKTALALHHKQIPATLHYTRPNPKLGLDQTPFIVNAELRDWTSDGPRRAGVSSFGVGGTNAHAILEEAPEHPESTSTRDTQLLVLSARSADALEAATKNLTEQIATHPLADTAWTLQTGRRDFNHRTAIIANSTGILKTLKPRNEERRQSPVVFMFPGQGSQYPNMGAELYKNEPVYRDTIDHCAALLDFDIRELIFNSDTADQLKQTRITQPALFVTEYALAKLWMSWGIQPDAMIGHSVGEYVAGALAGVFSLKDGLKLIVNRARLVQEQPPGTMLAIRAPESDVLPLLVDGTNIAAINSPNLCVAAGSHEDIAKLEAKLAERSIVAKHLHTSHAFHSAMMDPVIEPFTELLKDVKLTAPKIPYVSNVTGQWVTDAEATSPDYWAAHVRQTVRFADGISQLLDGDRILIEMGPGNTLATLTRQHPNKPATQPVISVLARDDQNEQQSTLEALAQFWQSGGTVDWKKFHGAEKRYRVPLPTYPFERQRYWAEPCGPQMHAANDGAPAPKTEMIAALALKTETAPASPAPEPVAGSPDLTSEILTELQDLSGMNLEGADPSTSFLELGFDSLFLTQASTTLSKKYGTKITFRNLLEDLDSPAALAASLSVGRASRPPEKTQVITQPAPTDLESRLAHLERLAGVATSALTTPAQKTTGIRAPKNLNPSSDNVSFGPFKPIKTTSDGTLTPQQQEHLDDLIARYIEHTPKSRDHVQSHRHHLADPRVVTGFNPAWKDMVYPLVTDRSKGAKLWDIDDNEYVDVTLGFGLSFLGHRPDFVIDAVKDQLDKGIEIGPSSPLAGEVAEMMCKISGMDRASFCNTGSEAVTAAIRTSRTVTGRDMIAMFEGAYHGIFDEILARPVTKNGELRTMAISPGIPEENTANIIVLEYGSQESLEILREHADRIACVLVETVQSRRPGLVPIEFLKDLRTITKEHGTALVFDEVVTGFRTHLSGSQGRFDIQADITTYGKVIGGGFPIGVVCGKREYMDALDGGPWQFGDDSFPEVGVTFFAGTFVRWPLALAAAKAVLTHLLENSPRLQNDLDAKTETLVNEMNDFLTKAEVPITFNRYSSMFMPHAAPGMKYHALLYYHMRLRNIHMWERPCFLSTVHTDEDCQKVIDALKESVWELQRAGFFPGTAPDAPKEPKTFPLTESQRELFLAIKLSPESAAACNDTFALRFNGTVDRDKIEQALNTLTNHHEALRTVFDKDGSAQIVLDSMPIKLCGIDEINAPFDLHSGPLFRACLQDNELILTINHIACDGGSSEVLLDTLQKAYSGKDLGTATPFHRYAAWQRRQSSDATRKFWLKEFESTPAPLNLPTDTPRPRQRSFRAGAAHTTITGDLLDGIRKLSSTNKTTPSSTLLTAMHTLLHRLSGQDDIVIGLSAAGQSHMEGGDQMIGHCVNFLPLRAKIDPAMTFTSLLQVQKDRVMDSFDHQHFSIGALLKELPNINRDPRRPVLASVSFTLEDAPKEFDFAPGITAKARIIPKDRLTFELSFYLRQSANSISIECIYAKDIYTEETIQRWLAHYTKLLTSAVAAPDTAIGEIEIQAPATSVKVEPTQPNLPLHRTFEKQVVLTPNATALTFKNQSLTYDELNQRANALAHHLRANFEIKSDTLVGICCERDMDVVIGILGILKAGGAYLPIDLAYPADRLAFMLEDSQAPVLLTQRSLASRLPEHQAAVVYLDELDTSKNTNNPDVGAGLDDLAYVIFTSGSTGKPKGAQITHRNVARLMTSTEHWFGFNEKDVWTLFHSYAFDFSVWELWGPLLYGGRLVIVPQSVSRSPIEFYQLLAQEKVTVLNQTPSAFRQLIRAEEEYGQKPLALRYIIFGGEALEMQSLKPWYDRHGDKEPQLVNMYGITETTVHVTYRALRAQDLDSGSVIGEPIPDLDVRILDNNQNPVPIGVTGEMFVAGDGLARGYLNRDELTRERFITDASGTRLYRTGDLARYLADGDIEYLGRCDDQVKIRGFRIELGEIESVLCQHSAIREACVIAKDERLIAYLATQGYEPTVTELREHLLEKVPDYMVPAAFVFIDKFPLTNNGKTDRKALPDPGTGRAELGNEFIAPANHTERTLSTIWLESLKLKTVGVNDNFFDLGGHSLLGLQIFNRIEKELGASLPLNTLFAAPTIRELASLIEIKEEPAELDHPSIVPLQTKGSRKPIFFIHALGGGDGGGPFKYQRLANLLGKDQPSYGLRAADAPFKTVESMAETFVHDLRQIQPEGPYQLAGYCMAGAVTFEMAQQLTALGQEVSLIGLIDGTIDNTPKTQAQAQANASVGKLAKAGLRSLKKGPLHVLKRLGQKFNHAKPSLAEMLNMEDYPEEAKAYAESHWQAFLNYHPTTYKGDLVLFTPKEQNFSLTNPEAVWSSVTEGNVKTITIPGDHDSILRDPNVKALASELINLLL